MNCRKYLLCCIALTIACGCNRDAIQPQEPVIRSPEIRDFGFEGSWRANVDNQVTDSSNRAVEPKPVTISMDENGVYSVKGPALRNLDVTFRVVSLLKDSAYAIVDIEVKEESAVVRYLAIAKREHEQLYLWWVEGKQLAKFMLDNGFSAVIERELLGTRVYAKSDELLKCVRKHSRSVVGKPDVFELVSE